MKSAKLALACMTVAVCAVAQETPPTPSTPQKQFKSPEEQALAVAANQDKDPANRLAELDKWKHDFPESDYADARLEMYRVTYNQLKRYHDEIQVSQEILKKDPNYLAALTGTIQAMYQINPLGADDREAASQAAHYLIDHIDDVFAPARKPADKTDAQWSDLKPQVKAYALNALGHIAQKQDSIDAALNVLKQDPTQTNLNVWLGGQYINQAKTDPSKIVLALFHFARAAVYDGPGAQPPTNRTRYKDYFDKQYKGYHGDASGEDAVLAVAKTNALPPPIFDIVSVTAISQQSIAAAQAARAANPMLALWNDIKTALTAADGQTYFDNSVKDTSLPAGVNGVTKFKGKIVSMTPAMRPKTIVLAVEKPGVADCTLELDVALPGNMAAGSELEFEGAGKSFTKDPYMLVLTTDKAKITGWAGRNPTPVRRPTKK